VDSVVQERKNRKLDGMFLNIAKEIATMSHCQRAKVGALLVKDSNIISFGYNGMPTGMNNCCEELNETGELVTKFQVIHAESNALLKAAKMGVSTIGATMYCTLSPCRDCSKLIMQSGVKRVVYLDLFNRDQGSVEFLSKFIKVEKYEY
jgi:dCMP deaminase